ncbi:hypothetical protein ACTGZS_12860, partial [Streptococcus suis]
QIALLSKTGDLKFVSVNASTGANTDTGLGGKDVSKATADYDPSTSQPVVRLQLKSGDSTKKFGDLTTQLSQSGGLLSTYLDADLVFGPATVK